MKSLLAALAVSLQFAAHAQTVDIPLGTTPLSEVGIYQVSYQSYGGAPVAMPPGWTGHFDPATGISYQPSDHLLGRDAILLHSPWRVPPGKTWIDFPIRLPDAQPLALRFGVAIRPEVAVPDKSDGVTFGCYVLDGDSEHELLHEHHALGEWKDFEFDLAPYAGKAITLRLQVEPGPKNSPSFDYSYFSNPVIVAGDGAPQAAQVESLLGDAAYRATADASLVTAENDSDRGVLPSNLLPCTNSIEPAGRAVTNPLTVEQRGVSFRFAYTGDDGRIVYTYTPATGTLDDFTVTANDQPAFLPAAGGGVTALVKQDGQERLVLLSGGQPEKLELGSDRRALRVVWEYPLNDGTVRVTWHFGIVGKALTVQAECDEPVLSGLSLGHEGNVAFRKPFLVPYLAGTINYLPVQRAFTCRYLDWTVSHGSSCPQGEALYLPKTDGTRNRLRESGYIAVSPRVAEVLPNLPHPPSPYLDLLGPRIMLDIWGHHNGTYQGDAENLRNLKDNGVDHLAIISHVWQRYGYDVKLPDHIPANPQFGGDEGMIVFGKAANECGYVWSLHENYIDMYPDAPSYDESALVLRQDGTPSPGWYNAGTGVQSFGLKCNRALEFARANSPIIHERYGTNAAYLDVHTCVQPWHQLDHDATQPMAAMALHKVLRDTELFQYERDTHGGPMFGEGNNHFYWGGRFDGAEAQVNGGEDHAPFLDFDLLKLHPQMVNHGMGYYERWFRRGYDHQWGYDTGTAQQVDKYRAQEIAYGHAGFIGNQQTDNVQWVAKEHHMMHPIQRLANTAKVTAVLYEVNGKLVPVEAALVSGQRERQHIVYDSGLRVWVNWGEAPWEVEGHTLPQWGVHALGPDTQVLTVFQDGKFADYAECPEFLFVDARTYFHMPYLNREKNIEPKLADFEWLGGNRFRIAYEWHINDTLDLSYKCFVHFTSPLIGTQDNIAFQQDHGLPKTTDQWQVGDVLMDGPYEVEIPTEPLTEYGITIGLHDPGRVSMKGVAAPGTKILLGKIIVERDENNAVTGARLGDIAEEAAAANAGKADFAAHMNPEGTWIDFGAVATDGSVKVSRGDAELVVFPYPRDKVFTVALNVAKIAVNPPQDMSKVAITALAAGTQEEIGPVSYEVKDGRVVFTTGTPDAGRYRIRW